MIRLNDKVLTVKELKESMKNIPDDAQVVIKSDTGVDQGIGTIVVEGAYHQRNNGDKLVIYANDKY